VMDADRDWAKWRGRLALSYLSMISDGPGVGGINIPFLFPSLPSWSLSSSFPIILLLL